MCEGSRHEVRTSLEGLLPRLWRFAITLTKAADRADDLVQATCEKMLSRADQYHVGTRLDSWAFTIMVNEWRSELRRPFSAPGVQVELESDVPCDPNASPEAQAYIKDILRGIDSLPDDQKMAVLLVYGEGYAYGEAAELLSIPIGTVMSRLHSARQKLRHLAEVSS